MKKQNPTQTIDWSIYYLPSTPQATKSSDHEDPQEDSPPDEPTDTQSK